MLQQESVERFHLGRAEVVLGLIAIVAMVVSTILTYGQFWSTNTSITGNVIAGAVFFACGLAAAIGWSSLTWDKAGASYHIVNVLIKVLALVGSIIYAWFALNGVA